MTPTLALLLLALVLPALGDESAKDDTPRGTLVVLNKSEGTASFLTPSGRQLGLLPTEDGPHEADVSPDGRWAVVANYGTQYNSGRTLSVYDLTTRTVARTIHLGEYRRPHGLDFIDERHLVVTVEDNQAAILVDIVEGKVIRSMPTTQVGSHMVVVQPGSTRAWVANIGSGSVSVVDTESGELVKVIPTAAGCEGIDITPDGTQVWSTNRQANSVSIIDTDSLEVLESISSTGRFPIRVKITPDGVHALVSNAFSGEVAVFDVATRKRTTVIPMVDEATETDDARLFADQQGPVPIGILIEPDGRHAYVANTNADLVTVLDLQTWSVVGRLEAGRQPDGMAWIPTPPDTSDLDGEE